MNEDSTKQYIMKISIIFIMFENMTGCARELSGKIQSAINDNNLMKRTILPAKINLSAYLGHP